MMMKLVLMMGMLFLVGVAIFPRYSIAAGQVNAETVLEMSKEKSAILLDVRTEREFQSGHIPGAINIPLNELPKRFSELGHEKQIVVYCRTGNRSRVAVRFLEGRGFDNIRDFSGSMVVWMAKRYPVSTGGQN